MTGVVVSSASRQHRARFLASAWVIGDGWPEVAASVPALIGRDVRRWYRVMRRAGLDPWTARRCIVDLLTAGHIADRAQPYQGPKRPTSMLLAEIGARRVA